MPQRDNKPAITEIREALDAARDLCRTVRRARRDGDLDDQERADIRTATAELLEEVADVVGGELLREAAARLRRAPLLAPGSGARDPGALT